MGLKWDTNFILLGESRVCLLNNFATTTSSVQVAQNHSLQFSTSLTPKDTFCVCVQLQAKH